VAEATLLLPIGAIEQHGPHLPVGFDALAATEVAIRAATALGRSGVGRASAADPEEVRAAALVLPPIAWGLSPYWLGFAGTLSLRPETILAVIGDVGASVARHGFSRMVIVNGHGGNAGIVAVAATALAEHGIRAAALSYWDLIREELDAWSRHDGGPIGHAGEVETSIALYLMPELVATEPVPAEACADLAAMAAMPYAGTFYAPPDPEREAPGGVYGFAPGGTRELGERVIGLAGERLAAFVRAFARGT